MDKPQIRVLMVEDSEEDAELVVRLIEKDGYSVFMKGLILPKY